MRRLRGQEAWPPADKRARARSILARPIAETLKEQQEVVRLTRREEREHLSPESILNLSPHARLFAWPDTAVTLPLGGAYWASEA